MSQPKSNISSWTTIKTFLKVGACSEAVMNVLDRVYDQPMEKEERGSSLFAGGIMQKGYQCGMIWGAALAAGAEAFKRFGAGPKAEAMAIRAAGRIVKAFRNRNEHINCMDIAKTDWTKKSEMFKHFITGGPIHCFRMAGRTSPLAHDAIEAAFEEGLENEPQAPVSCAAVLARQMGADDKHAAMVAGFAGGIGLCGEACGALGVAVWLHALKEVEGGESKSLWESKAFQEKVDELTERLLKASDYEFECSAIVGRTFKNVEDHAAYIRNGGCAEILKLLAGESGD